MRKSVRRVLFYIFFSAFLILAPLLVLYTAGYRFSLKSGINLDVGSLSITTLPRRVSISLNGADTQERSPTVFQELTPGRYEVILSRTGYLPWRGKFEVAAGLTTYIQHAFLFRESHPIALLSELGPEDIAAVKDKKGMYTRTRKEEGGSVTEVLVYSSRPSSAKLVATIAGPALKAEWSLKGDYFFIKTPQTLHVFKSTGEEIVLNAPESFTVGEVVWDTADDTRLHVYPSADSTSAITFSVATGNSIEQRELTPQEERIGSVGQSDFFLKQLFTSSVLTVARDGQEQELVNLPRSNYKLASVHAPYLVLKDSQGDLYLVNTSTLRVTVVPAKQGLIAWNPELGQMTYTNDIELNILTLQQEQQDIVLRSAEPIRSLLWHPNGQRIIFATSQKVEAIDAYQYAIHRDRVTIGTFDDIESVTLDTRGKYMYVLGTREGVRNLYSVRLY